MSRELREVTIQPNGAVSGISCPKTFCEDSGGAFHFTCCDTSCAWFSIDDNVMPHKEGVRIAFCRKNIIGEVKD